MYDNLCDLVSYEAFTNSVDNIVSPLPVSYPIAAGEDSKALNPSLDIYIALPNFLTT